MRVVVAGARRARQGIGAFVAKSLQDCGCEVAGVVGTSPETAGEAAAVLGARAYVDLREAIARESPGLVAICTPIELHAEQLAIVAEAGCHCLCDKPLVWGAGVSDVLDAFDAGGKHLALLTQWRVTLDTYWTLFPDLENEDVRAFEMWLSPSSTGARMLLDSLSHPLSMLERLCGAAQVRDVELAVAEEDCHARFSYGEARCSVSLRHTTTSPRAAAFAVNGRRADRVIGEGYSMVLEDASGNRVSMPDPMPLRVREIVDAARAGIPTDRAALERGQANLEALLVGLQP